MSDRSPPHVRVTARNILVLLRQWQPVDLLQEEHLENAYDFALRLEGRPPAQFRRDSPVVLQ